MSVDQDFHQVEITKEDLIQALRTECVAFFCVLYAGSTRTRRA